MQGCYYYDILGGEVESQLPLQEQTIYHLKQKMASQEQTIYHLKQKVASLGEETDSKIFTLEEKIKEQTSEIEELRGQLSLVQLKKEGILNIFPDHDI